MHQPVAEISPSTLLHELGATKRLQASHCFPSFGEAWYLTVDWGSLAAFAPRAPNASNGAAPAAARRTFRRLRQLDSSEPLIVLSSSRFPPASRRGTPASVGVGQHSTRATECAGIGLGSMGQKSDERTTRGQRVSLSSVFRDVAAELFHALVGQRFQECDKRVDVPIAETRFLSLPSVVGNLLGIHCVLVCAGEIVELVRLAGLELRVPALRIGVARRVESDGVAQRGEIAVVIVGSSNRDVAQRRHLECAAKRFELDLLRQNRLDSRSLAEPEIEDRGVCVRRNRRITRYAQRVVGEVRENPVGRVLRVRLADVAGDAVAYLRVSENFKAARLDGRELRLAAQIVVKLGREGGEAFGRLVGEDRFRQVRYGRLRIVKDVRSEN